MHSLPQYASRRGCSTLLSTQPRPSQSIRCSSDLHQILRTEFRAHRSEIACRAIRPLPTSHHEYHTPRAPQSQSSSSTSKGTCLHLATKATKDRGNPITLESPNRRTVRSFTGSVSQRQQQLAPVAEGSDEDRAQDSLAASDVGERASEPSTESSPGNVRRTGRQESAHSGNSRDERNDATNLASPGKKPFYPRPPLSITVPVDGTHLASLLKTIRDARKLGLPDSSQVLTAEPEGFNLAETLVPPRPALSHASASLKNSFNVLKKLSAFRDRMAERTRLPMMAKDTYEKLIQLLDEADVLVIAGQTGSGKTTQVPQIILDYAIHRGVGASCNIICTQPRRISATSIARRVAHERCESLGRSVGYHVRFDKRRPSQDGSILYCTNGVLLKQLQEDPDLYLTRMSHIIIDEVHERSLATDHLLTLFRELMHQRKAKGQSFPKLILMSATIDTKAFVDYCQQPSIIADDRNESQSLDTRFLEVEGRVFPVECKFLEDFLPQLQAETDASIMHLLQSTGDNPDKSTKPYIKAELEFAAKVPEPARKVNDDDGSSSVEQEEATDDAANAVDPDDPDDPAEYLSPCGLAAATVAHVAKKTRSGDILVFVPGFMEIDRISDLLIERKPLGFNVDSDEFKLFKLHSTRGELNDEVFTPVLPGCRRIVVSTNIAESSLTLPQVEHVIDMGKVRYYTHDHFSGDREYAARWISKASSKQRLGRAGRVLPGNYYALFTRERYESFEDHLDPEMARISIVGTCLDAVAQKVTSDVETFFNRCPTPPKPEAVTAALETLRNLGAVTDNQELTALGRVLSLVPLQPEEGKAVLLGILFQCLEPMLITACYDTSTPIVHHPSERALVSATRRRYAERSESDLISVVNAFKAYDAAQVRGDREELQTLASEHYIKPMVYQEIRLLARQIYQHLAYAELVPQLQNPEGHVFSQIPSYLNRNADNIPLVKALLMSCLTTNLAICRRHSGREWTTRGNEKALMEPRTVNVTSGKIALEEHGRIRTAGDMLAYNSRRDMQEDKYPWILGGSMVTPLMAVLFASAAERKGDRISLDGIVDVEFKVKNNLLNLDQKTTTTMLLEARKAMDRFLLTAFEDLRYSNFKGRLGKSYGLEEQEAQEHSQAHRRSLAQGYGVPTKSRSDFSNTIMRNTELRDTVVNGLADTLKAEDEALMELFERQKAEEANRVNQERDEQTKAVTAANQARKVKGAKPTATTVKDGGDVASDRKTTTSTSQADDTKFREKDLLSSSATGTAEPNGQGSRFRYTKVIKGGVFRGKTILSSNGGVFRLFNLNGQSPSASLRGTTSTEHSGGVQG